MSHVEFSDGTDSDITLGKQTKPNTRLRENKRQDTGWYGQGMNSICPTFGVTALAWIYTGVGYDIRHFKLGCEMSGKYPKICLKDKEKFKT